MFSHSTTTETVAGVTPGQGTNVVSALRVTLARVRVVMTLVVRDEADILDTQLAYHLDAGVDFVIATDHRSTDGTSEILESYEREGYLRLFREEGEFIRQRDWQTRMSRLAATEYDADWVMPSDADEFWWPQGESLKEALSAVPEAYGSVRALSRNFIPGRDDRGWFAERLTVRLAMQAPINDPASTFRPVIKVAHRGHAHIRFPKDGAHRVFGLPQPLLNSSSPLEVLHLPFRSRAQCAWKYRRTWTGWQENIRGDLARARALTEGGRADEIWDRVAVEDDVLELGLADGSLVRDTRIRDALRALHVDVAGSVAVPRGRASLSRAPRSADIAYAVDLAIFDEAEIVRAARRVDEAEARVAKLESSRRRRRRAVASGRPA
jgi:hypothetical protein